MPAIRERVVAMLAQRRRRSWPQGVADGLGIDVPAPLPLGARAPPQPEVERSPALSLLARPGDGSDRRRASRDPRRRTAWTASGAQAVHDALPAAGAVPRFVGARLGTVESADGGTIDVEVTLEAAPSVLFDAVVVPDGDGAVEALRSSGPGARVRQDQYRHCKPILVLGAGAALLEGRRSDAAAGRQARPGHCFAQGRRRRTGARRLFAAIGKHRHFERQIDPPAV